MKDVVAFGDQLSDGCEGCVLTDTLHKVGGVDTDDDTLGDAERDSLGVVVAL